MSLPKPIAVPPLSVLSGPYSYRFGDAERLERGLVEGPRPVDIRDRHANMIEHASSSSHPVPRRSIARRHDTPNSHHRRRARRIGSGLAVGRSRACRVRLSEMRGGGDTTPAHDSDRLAEMVCSNSFRSDDADQQCGRPAPPGNARAGFADHARRRQATAFPPDRRWRSTARRSPPTSRARSKAIPISSWCASGSTPCPPPARRSSPPAR